jgi:hypothetical protein
VYHLFPGWVLHSGFVGVDVFFVISGFLITSLLLREHDRTGRIALLAFWTRRARRLLPALAVVVTVSASAAWLVGGDVLLGLGRQVLGAITFSSNWASISAGASYFAGTQPELLRNLWSLAVEEQFYVLWPLLLPVFLLLPRRAMRAAVAVVLAAASLAWAAQLAGAGSASVDLTRVLRHRHPRLRPADRRRAGVRAGRTHRLECVGARIDRRRRSRLDRRHRRHERDRHRRRRRGPGGAEQYPLVPAVASVLTAVAIAAATHAGSWFGRALDVAPLRWIGERSYGIYLWHWPVVVLLALATTGGFLEQTVPVAVGLGAAASRRRLRSLVPPARTARTPPRLPGAGRHCGRACTRRRHGASGRSRPWASGRSCSAARRPPSPPPAGQLQPGGGRGGPARARRGIRRPHPAVGQRRCPLPTPTPQRRRAPTASRCPGAGHRERRPVTAVGDSVMLASAGGLLDELPGVQIDAEVSRSMWAGSKIIDRLSDQGALRDYVVVGLGTNGPVDSDALQDIYDRVGRDRTLVLVTAFAPATGSRASMPS